MPELAVDIDFNDEVISAPIPFGRWRWRSGSAICTSTGPEPCSSGWGTSLEGRPVADLDAGIEGSVS